jgi:WD40 repeat protein/serine/threonine protein kinase
MGKPADHDSGFKGDLRAWLARVPEVSPAELVEVVQADQQRRWRRGERVPVETYLRLCPALAADAEEVLDLVVGEWLMRQELGEAPALEEFLWRFPQFAEALRVECELNEAFAAADTPPRGGGTATVAQAVPGVAPAPPGYEILGELGRGGIGVVYKARQVGLDRVVALKMLQAGPAARDDDLARFRAEAEAVARLQHPNIVQVYEVGECQGQPFLALEFINGGSLADRLDGAPWPAGQAAALLETLAGAAHAAHERGIIHRDLKPANILLQKSEIRNPKSQANSKDQNPNSETPRAAVSELRPSDFEFVSEFEFRISNFIPKLADFGLAKRVEGDRRLTRSGVVMGTPCYMAPEQATARRDLGPAADVYALGAILYELLTGHPPFRAETAVDTLLLVVHEDPVRPRRLQPTVPRDLETICLKCLHKDPRRRYASAAALAEDLRRFQAGEPITARPVGVPERALKWARRRPAVAGLLAALAAAVLAAFAAVGWGYVTAEGARRDEARQRRDAVAARDVAEDHLYFSRIALADRFLEGNDLAGASRLLADCLAPEGRSDRRGWEWYYLQRLCAGGRRTLAGHDGYAYQVAFSPDGHTLASAGGGNPYWKTQGPASIRPGAVILWDADSGAAIRTFRGHANVIDRLAFSADGRLLATSGPDGKVKLWDVVTGREVLTCPFPPGLGPTTLSFSGDGRVLAALWRDGARFWELPGGRELPAGRGDNPAFAPATRLVAAGDAGETRVWDVLSGRLVHTLRGAGGPRAFSPDGKVLAAGVPQLTWWHLDGGREQRLPSPYRTFSLAFGPDGKQLVVVGKADFMTGGLATVLDVADGRLRQQLQHGGGDVCLAFSPDGRLLATGSADRCVRVWDQGRAVRRLYRGHTAAVAAVAFSPDGQRLASAGEDGQVIFWDPTRDPRGVSFRPEKGYAGEGLAALAFSPDGRAVCTTRVYDGLLLREDAVTGRLLSEARINIDPTPVYPRGDVAYSADARLLAGPLRGDRRVVQLWDATTAQAQASYRGPPGTLRATAFRADGRQVASAHLQTGPDAAPVSAIRIWDADTGQERVRFPPVAQILSALAFSPDGKRLASGGFRDGTVRLWDATSGQEQLALPGCRNAVCLAFNPQGSRLAAADFGGNRLRVWDTATGNEVLAVPAPETLTGVAFSADGRRLAATGYDCSVRLWDAATGHDSLVLRSLVDDRLSDYGFTAHVVFSPDGTRLAANVWSGFTNVWDSGAAAP